ncbi:hypothetical protein DY000_02041455 [Brassica cretica]|uniref:Uncharacterized protein n=1 Tax=Brassica cretica TaxID=69181 RepID=A0ABQ7BGI8_BRACR|nr:hypothetical protein DY000_02041455 [Brassica cretica]
MVCINSPPIRIASLLSRGRALGREYGVCGPVLLGTASCAGGYFEALGELFLVGPLRLRADHRGGQNYRDLDSRLNLALPFAASCWCGLV